MKKEVVIYSKSSCPFCVRAKQLLDAQNHPYVEHDLDKNPSLRQPLVERTQYNKVPQIFVDDKFIGGFTELQQMISTGEL